MDNPKRHIACLLIGLGIVIYVIAEILRFFGFYYINTFFTPIAWTAYILFMDGINHLWHRRSLIIGDTKNFLWMLPISIGLWYLFEFYNLFLDNWHYINLPENRAVRYSGYFWSFATIWPGILETYILLCGFKFFNRIRVKPYILKNRTFWILVITGAVFEILPFIFPGRYWAPAIWTGFILLLDPINFRFGLPSLFKQWESGNMSGLFRLLASGLVCGILWEFWNYRAGAKWEYTVPYFGDAKIFEMPIIGYLGFLPFAVEVFVMYVFIGWLFNKLFRIKVIKFDF